MARTSRDRSVVTRRDAIRLLGMLACGAAFAGCDTLRVAFRAYPPEFDLRPDLCETVLRAFVCAVVPGAPIEDPNLVRVYFDEDFPFAPYSAFLASDLCDRSEARFGVDRFDRLNETGRTEIIRGALREGGTTGRLYTGAVYVAQVAFYAGIYDDEAGCELIDFPGQNGGARAGELSYPDPQSYLAPAATGEGSPA